MKKRIFTCLGVLAALTLTSSACGTPYESKIYRNFIFGVSADVVITDRFSDSSVAACADEFNGEVKNFLARLEASLSTSVTTSCIYAFNEALAGETVEVDELTYNVLNTAMSVYRLTDGYYNPAVYYCVDLYGFAPRADDTVMPYDREEVVNDDGTSYLPLPDEKYVTTFKELAEHFGDTVAEEREGRYYVTKPADAYVTVDGARYEMKIDLGGIGKGYCADVIDEMFDEYAFEYGYFNFGSSSMAVKKSYEDDNGEWNLAVTEPRMALPSFAKVKVGSANLSTSGDYERYYEIDGVRYCHIIDTTTGSPVQTGIASVTVIGGSAAEDDALTTALSAMGKEKAIDFINERLSDRKVILLCFEGGKGEIITNIPDALTVTNSAYEIANTVTDGKIII